MQSIYWSHFNLKASVYSYQGKSVCFLGNANTSDAFTVEFENTNYTVPAWSVTILPDCFTEAYNTAKVDISAVKLAILLLRWHEI